MMTDVDEVFDDDKPEVDTEVETEVETEEDVKGEAEPEVETKEVEKTEEVKTDEKASEPPAEEDEPKLVPIAALHDERRKRKESEKELEKVSALVPKVEEEPDMYDDPDAWKQWNTDKVLSQQRAEQDKLTREKLEESRSKLLEKESDYDAMERVFELMALRDASLVGKMLASDNPAQYAYDKAVSYRNSLLGSPPASEPTEDEIRNNAAADAVNLVNATAQDQNTPAIEKEETVDELFEDQVY